ncbi:MAG: type II restriction endonuclease, partial [Crocinitomicaceae bacterium]
EFSEFARNNLSIEVISIEEPDTTLMAWLEFEESLFRRLERHIVAERIEKGFVDNEETDVDGFIKFSLSVQNRRKSRAGLSLENHLEPILLSHSIAFERGAKTENNSSPDFIFPNSEEYHNPIYNAEKLAMLGVKTSCKDRWRQVLSEAKRIENKHLLTLEPGITESQTDEMKFNNLQLVLPKKIHETYSEAQKSWLFNLEDFLSFLKEIQSG